MKVEITKEQQRKSSKVMIQGRLVRIAALKEGFAFSVACASWWEFHGTFSSFEDAKQAAEVLIETVNKIHKKIVGQCEVATGITNVEKSLEDWEARLAS